MHRLTPFILFVLLGSIARTQHYPPSGLDEQQLVKSCNPILSLSEQELLALVPVQGGFRFSGSPESQLGAQENNMIWKLSFGNKVQCQFTKTFFPNEKYPENDFLEVITPTGKIQRYNFHQDAQGKKYWFEGRRWYEQRIFIERTALQLAQLHFIDPAKYAKAGNYARLILTQFARLYPDYVVTFEYPGQEKKFFTDETYPDEVVRMDQNAWRLAKWSWWAYMDVSENLLLAYDLLKNTEAISGTDQRLVENDLFLPMLSFVDRYADLTTTNMHPTLWRAQAVASNLFAMPELAQSVTRGISQMLESQFTQEGFWKETTVSYHRQTATGLLYVFNLLYPNLSEDEKMEKMKTNHPGLFKSLSADKAFKLPNGHYASINDTWASDRYQPVIDASKPHLMTGTGYAVLGMGSGKNQMQAHLNFNGHFGHDHMSGLNLTLFAKEKELVSDLGYTHTLARTWAASSTAHNLVVVNGKSQSGRDAAYHGTGNLLLFSGNDPGFQAVEADATNLYESEGISAYRRALIAVETTEGNHYVADFFTVTGKGRKDWILHGSADEPQQITVEGPALTLKKSPTLVPEGITFREINGLVDAKLLRESYWGHSNFRNVLQGTSTGPLKSTFHYTENPGKGLQTWIPSNHAAVVSTAEAWSIRNTKENQGKLDNYLRPALMISREDSLALFSAVHAPFDGPPSVLHVSTVYEGENAIILKITPSKDRVDYLIYAAPESHNLTVRLEGQPLYFDGRIGLISIQAGRTTLKMIDATRLTFGKKTLTGKQYSSTLLAVEGNRLTVDGRVEGESGEVFIVRHGNGRTSAFHIESIDHQVNRTVITTRESSVFELNDQGKLRMKVFPFFEYDGPHEVVR